MTEDRQTDHKRASVEMPLPTVAPLVLSLAIALVAVGVATSAALIAVGAVLLVVGLAMWTGQLLPGCGHAHEPLVAAELRPKAVVARTGKVERLKSGMAGYRLRLPEKVHPISAGIKGGIAGGAAMPIPAILYGILSGHGIWLPVNLLCGMVLPGVDDQTLEQLESFQPALLVMGAVIHSVISLIAGLMYGVLMPTLPRIATPLVWGGMLLPLFWTAMSYSLMGIVNPVLQERVDWPWFIASQFVFGIVAAIVVVRSEEVFIPPAGQGPDRRDEFVAN